MFWYPFVPRNNKTTRVEAKKQKKKGKGKIQLYISCISVVDDGDDHCVQFQSFGEFSLGEVSNEFNLVILILNFFILNIVFLNLLIGLLVFCFSLVPIHLATRLLGCRVTLELCLGFAACLGKCVTSSYICFSQKSLECDVSDDSLLRGLTCTGN